MSAVKHDLAGQGIDVCYAADGYTTARRQIEASLKRQGLVGGGHGGNWDVSETMAVSCRLVRPRLFAAGDTARNGNTPMNARGLSRDSAQQKAGQAVWRSAGRRVCGRNNTPFGHVWRRPFRQQVSRRTVPY